MLTLDLKKSNNLDTIQGKLILNISTNVNAPIRNGTNTLTSATSQSSNSNNATNTNTTSTAAAVTNTTATNITTSTAPSVSSSRVEEDSRNHDLPEG